MTEHRPDLSRALPIYLKIGLLSFGGPAGQIALMQTEICARRKWVDDATFQRGLSVSMLLPGPEAQQLATWLGWRLHGLGGGLAAGLAFILPGAALMVLLAWIAATHGQVGWVAAIFFGVQPAVLVIVARALISLARRTLTSPMHWALALLAFLGIWAAGLPFPLIVGFAAIAGFALPYKVPSTITTPKRVPVAHAIWTLALGLGLLAAVYFAVRMTLGTDPFDGLATLFTSAAFVSFGGAYALLPYVADRAVETYQWLDASQMLNGLAIAEATPGPLILVNVYAGYFAGADSGQGVLTAWLACFYTFVPSFMLILAVAPYVAALERIAWARRALAGVAAAVAGVVLNLAVYLGEAALFPQGLAAPEVAKLVLLAVFALLVIFRPIAMTTLVLAGVVAGLALYMAGLVPG